MNDYDKICYHCGNNFSILEGEGWGRPYIKKDAMLPSTVWECNKCLNREVKNE